jgi:DNA polymerase-3 subunit epsilon
MITIDKPLITFDIESTGTDPATDRIISLAALKQRPGETRESLYTWLVNPGIPIPPASTKIHGITDEDVKDMPLISEFAEEIHGVFSGADLCGYSIRGFDVCCLWEELYRCGLKLDLTGVRIIDTKEIFHRKERRDLKAAVRKYCNREHNGAHEAMADAVASWDVLIGQRGAYEDIGAMDIQGLHDFCGSDEFEGLPAKRYDLAGHLVQTAEGVVRYTMRRARGVAVHDDPGLGFWMLKQSFPESTKILLEELLRNPPRSSDQREMEF